MKSIFWGMALLSIWLMPLAQAGSVNLINSGTEFRKFLDQFHEAKSPEEKLTAWDIFEAKYAAIYNEYIFNRAKPNWEQKRKERLEKFFEQLPEQELSILAFFTAVDDQVRKQVVSFAQMFPDVGENIPVYILPSVGGFDGKADRLKDRKGEMVILSADVIVARHADLDVLFHREFFHAYHFHKLLNMDFNTMATPLWLDGFATYASSILNPNKPDTAILTDDALATACAKPDFVKGLAQAYLLVMPMRENDPNADETMADWFMNSGKTLPKRRGFCLGLMVFRSLAKYHSVNEMVYWDENRFSQELVKALPIL